MRDRTTLCTELSVVATTSTDQSGTYRVANLPDGPYLVVAQYPSLAEKQQSVTIVEGKPVTLEFVMQDYLVHMKHHLRQLEAD